MTLFLQGHLPFAVVGSTEEVCVGNKMVKARQYPWGVVQGKMDLCFYTPANPFGCNFITLKRILSVSSSRNTKRAAQTVTF